MKHLLLSVFVGLLSVSAATDTTLCEPLDAPVTDEMLAQINEAHVLLQESEYEKSISTLEKLRRNALEHCPKYFLLDIMYKLAANYECMFVLKVGTVDQQRENINKTIELCEQIIRETGSIPIIEYIQEKSSSKLQAARAAKAEFELRHLASK